MKKIGAVHLCLPRKVSMNMAALQRVNPDWSRKDKRWA